MFRPRAGSTCSGGPAWRWCMSWALGLALILAPAAPAMPPQAAGSASLPPQAAERAKLARDLDGLEAGSTADVIIQFTRPPQDDDFAARTESQRAWVRQFLDALECLGLTGKIRWKI